MRHQGVTQRVLALLERKNARYKFRELRDLAKCSNRELEQVLADIRDVRPNLVYAKFDRTFYLSDTPTWYSLTTDLSKAMPNEGVFGLISDTHLCSVAERLDLVNYAYDVYAEHGVKQVFHTGDLTDGWKEYKGHMNFVKVYGDQPQALYAIRKYPRREGITTYVIGGNHDDSYRDSKLDRLSLVHRGFHHQGQEIEGRADVIYLGQYSHTIVLPQQVTLHMLHPRGGGAYARSWKQQKRSEAMDRDSRPDIQASGHFHTFNYIWDNHTHFLALPGLQDETEFFKRLGLPRSIGFMLVHYGIKKGRVAYLAPRLFMF